MGLSAVNVETMVSVASNLDMYSAGRLPKVKVKGLSFFIRWPFINVHKLSYFIINILYIHKLS